MLFKRKEKTGQSPVQETSRPPRYTTFARIGINGFEGVAALRNVSTGGFCMESKTYAAIAVGEHYTMQLKPEAGANLQDFELGVEVRWVRSTETSFSSGFLIVKPPAGQSLEKYIGYIKSKN
ncbi:MAG: hypothetical protein LBK13_12195 [Spirochaetales bacterium]|jgi:hypothetical protein|nr:hypothetical protein [Spirochaetales bacterium]